MERTVSNTEKSSVYSDVNAISDDDINYAYNLFNAESMNKYRSVRVRLDRSFKARKARHKDEWANFEKLISMCREHEFNLKCYIKYCFHNRLVPHGKGKALRDVEYLLHYQQIAVYSRLKDTVEKQYKVYMNILKSVMRLKKTKNETGESITRILKEIFKSGHLGNYISSGVISRYFLALIPNITSVLYEATKNSVDEEHHLMDDLCSTIESYKKQSIDALRTFWPDACFKSIIQICEE